MVLETEDGGFFIDGEIVTEDFTEILYNHELLVKKDDILKDNKERK